MPEVTAVHIAMLAAVAALTLTDAARTDERLTRLTVEHHLTAAMHAADVVRPTIVHGHSALLAVKYTSFVSKMCSDILVWS